MSNHFARITSITSIAFAMAGLLVACGTPPADLDLSLKHPSSQGHFVVEMQPPEGGAHVGQIQTWTLKIDSVDGAPIRQARIAVDGGMPQHGHGMPTKPRVTKELGPGRYAIEGMKFSMNGWWDLRLEIDAGAVQDKAVFNIMLSDGSLKR